jgi:hypothetical protein
MPALNGQPLMSFPPSTVFDFTLHLYGGFICHEEFPPLHRFTISFRKTWTSSVSKW